ncbi:hypothetical protein L198_05554 [Cryptococcus wingfieldii CBS 7118]|uniref:Uncharacterized protein n=1 Tax=Cryptococcus wingfieldii CBS 7118 TaxID=1295528 RepID=A0A1E3IVW3_9TREE|nr:hypothetical protein L198_05554 [Cryptococcus wingfieldii CBS 7118]ODN92760.1 hypothetical protein L198_05554 [Cryptococcus wingfieldii CBS 7118]
MESVFEGIPILEGPDDYYLWATTLEVCPAADPSGLLGVEKEPCWRDVTVLTGLANDAIRPPEEAAGDAFPPVGARTPSDVPDEEMRERWEKWAKKERKARWYLTMAVSENIRGVWPRPREGDSAKASGTRQLYPPPNSNASTRRQHLQRFENILNDLEILGEPMLEEDKIRAFFRSLGNDYERIGTLFVSKPPFEQTWIHLTSLINFETSDMWPTRRGGGRRGKRGTAADYEKHV